MGAVIAKNNRIISLGFNGFPPQIEDKPEWLNNREEKYRFTIHAEMNAILNAPANVEGSTLYLSPLAPCPHCAKHIVASGIVKVVAFIDTNSKSPYLNMVEESSLIFDTGGVESLWITNPSLLIP